MHRQRTPLVSAALVAVAAISLTTFAGSAAATRATPSAVAGLELPAPSGRQTTGTTTLHLVDRSRLDPFAGGRRELMVQLWYPAAKTDVQPAPYLTPAMASALEAAFRLPEGTFGTLPTHSAGAARIASGKHPLLLFSHGLLTMRGYHTSLLEELASRGYVVAAIDHTYDAALVELPHGRLVEAIAAARPTPKQNALLLATRVADVRFVLDKLTRLTNARTGLLARRLDMSRVGALGHSFGGATAAATMLADRRIDAGVNLDGKVWGPVVSKGLSRPFMLLIGDALGGRLTPDQAQFLSHLRSARYGLRLAGARHFSFTDLALFASELPGLDELFDIGSIDPNRANSAVRAYVAAFFDKTLLGKRGRLLDRPSPAHPEVHLLDGAARATR